MTWQDLLRSRTESLGLTQQGLADALTAAGSPIGQAAVSKWLRGASAPEDERLPVLVAVLSITEAEFREVTGYDLLPFSEEPPAPRADPQTATAA